MVIRFTSAIKGKERRFSVHTTLVAKGNGTEEKVLERGFQGRFERTDRYHGRQEQGVGSR